MKSPKHVVPMLVALMLAAMLGGCSKNTTPTSPDPTLDQAPPAIPAQIVADKDASTGAMHIEWTPSSSANVASYEIYKYSPDPEREGAYVLVGTTDAETTQYTLPWSSLGITYYHLRATSTAGVQSNSSAPLQVTFTTSVGTEPDPNDGIIHKQKP